MVGNIELWLDPKVLDLLIPCQKQNALLRASPGEPPGASRGKTHESGPHQAYTAPPKKTFLYQDSPPSTPAV